MCLTDDQSLSKRDESDQGYQLVVAMGTLFFSSRRRHTRLQGDWSSDVCSSDLYGDWGSRKYLLASLDQSLARMGLEYVDIFYSHRADPDTPLEETMGALATAVTSGKALYAGISSYSAERTAQAAAILRQLGTPLLIHQPSYSMLNRWIEDGLLDTLAAEGVGCIAFSPLAQGVLTGKYLAGVPTGSRASQDGSLSADQLSEENLARVSGLNDIALA